MNVTSSKAYNIVADRNELFEIIDWLRDENVALHLFETDLNDLVFDKYAQITFVLAHQWQETEFVLRFGDRFDGPRGSGCYSAPTAVRSFGDRACAWYKRKETAKS